MKIRYTVQLENEVSVVCRCLWIIVYVYDTVTDNRMKCSVRGVKLSSMCGNAILRAKQTESSCSSTVS